MAPARNSNSSSGSDTYSPIPSVIERLGELRPTKELLDYYRKKISEYDDENKEFHTKLDRFKYAFEEQHRLSKELIQREDEVLELQKALSDMETFLFQERENVLRLYAENDRLKIQEVNDRKKIQHLLTMTKPTDTDITYFIRDHPGPIILRGVEKKPGESARPHSPIQGRRENIKLKDRGPGGHQKVKTLGKVMEKKKINENKDDHQDRQALLLQIDSLQAQLEEKITLSNDQVNSLLEDRRVQLEETEAQQTRSSQKIYDLTEQLKKTQELLYESTKDFLELKYDCRLKERKWMNERDTIMQEMDYLKEQINFNKEEAELQKSFHVNAGTQMTGSPNRSDVRVPIHVSNKLVIKQLRNNLEQTQNMAEMYREQVIGLEDELARIREEKDVGRDLFKEKTNKLTQRLQLMNQRYEALEKRRGFEVEGFKTDIKLLRGKLKELEKQLFKVTVNIGEQFDWEILNKVHQTATRSKRIAGEIHHLKTKVYGLENDLKNI